jgi:hypothetical protein
MRHDVVAMEHYVATDQRPLDKCLADVAECDIYVGVFAWRYGYVPATGNPAGKSITELEYRQAQKLGKPCLIFLVDEMASWPDEFKDTVSGENDGGRRIEALREELGREYLVSFFNSAEELATLVVTAVYHQEPRGRVPLQRPLRPVHFTDRKRELEQLLLDLQPGRVVTLCGPGGIGKTALAAEAIWQLAPGNEPPDRFPDGVIFHSFYNQPAAKLALENIARAFGEEPQPTPQDAAKPVFDTLTIE